MNAEARWQQRFHNLTRAYETLRRIIAIENPNEAERMGLIQAFEMTFELSWKTVSDYLKGQGFEDVSTPRKALKQAYQIGMITNGHAWMNALENRNETTHAYDEAKAEAVELRIREEYFPIIRELYLFFSQQHEKQRSDG